MKQEDFNKSSVRNYHLKCYLSDHDPFEAYRDDVGERSFQTVVDWDNAPKMLTALPDVRFVHGFDVVYTDKNDNEVVVAKAWVGISSENDHLQEALYTPAYYDAELDHTKQATTFILPAGSSVRGVELIQNTRYDIDYDNRFRGLMPSVTQSPEVAEENLRGAYSGYRDWLNILVRYRTRDGKERVVILNQPEQGDFMMPTRPYDYWEKQGLLDHGVAPTKYTALDHPAAQGGAGLLIGIDDESRSQLLEYLSDPHLFD